ncbi:phage baseplate assembly protein V [Phormidesmis sp. 146-35]
MSDQYFGKYTGIVKDNRDDQNLGQIQVSVPTIFPPDELMVARPALPYGFFFIPEVDAKVWVEFEGGDSGLPIWTGIQYVAGEWAAEAEANPPEKRVIKTASEHLIIFNDKSDEKAIQIQSANGHTITLDKDGIKINDGVNSHSLTFDANGAKLQTQSGAKVELTATATKIETGQGAKVELMSGMTTVDSGGRPIQIKGSSVLLGASPVAPVMRMTDQAIGNLGAPVVLISTSTVIAS